MSVIFTTGLKYPGLGSTVDRSGGQNWGTPTAIQADDTTYSAQAAAGATDYLIGSQYGFAVPTTATIVGVIVHVGASETGTSTGSYIPQLSSAATPTLIGSAKGAVTVNGTTIVDYTSGANNDVWGATLTPAVVNATGFGATIWGDETRNVKSVDYIAIEVFYTLPVTDLVGGGTTIPWPH